MELLLTRAAYALGSLLIPFAGIYISTRKTKISTIGRHWIYSFAMAWLLQTIVVLAVGETATITILSALVLSAISVLHVDTIIHAIRKRNEDQQTPTKRKSWLAFYIRLLILYLPAALIFGALLGLVAELFKELGFQPETAGALSQIPASIYASYFSYRWLYVPHES